MYTECDPALGEGSGLEDLLKFHPSPHFRGLEKQDQVYDDHVSRSDSVFSQKSSVLNII